MRTHNRIIFIGVRNAKMTKYAVNSMRAAEISFMNEFGVLGDRVGVDGQRVRSGIWSESRIGYSFYGIGTAGEVAG